MKLWISAITDGTGVGSTPSEVVDYGAHSPLHSTQLWLQITPAGSWLALGILQPNNPPVWQATVGSTIADAPCFSEHTIDFYPKVMPVRHSLVTGVSVLDDETCTSTLVMFLTPAAVSAAPGVAA